MLYTKSEFIWTGSLKKVSLQNNGNQPFFNIFLDPYSHHTISFHTKEREEIVSFLNTTLRRTPPKTQYPSSGFLPRNFSVLTPTGTACVVGSAGKHIQYNHRGKFYCLCSQQFIFGGSSEKSLQIPYLKSYGRLFPSRIYRIWLLSKRECPEVFLHLPLKKKNQADVTSCVSDIFERMTRTECVSFCEIDSWKDGRSVGVCGFSMCGMSKWVQRRMIVLGDGWWRRRGDGIWILNSSSTMTVPFSRELTGIGLGTYQLPCNVKPHGAARQTELLPWQTKRR